MAISCKCFSGLVATAVAVLLLPAQEYVEKLYPELEEAPALAQFVPPGSLAWFDLTFTHFPPLDVFVTVTMLILGLFAYLCEWIQRKLIERRIVKLNQYLSANVQWLRTWDTQQEQLEATLRMVQNATSEYSQLLYLMLCQHRYLAAHNTWPSKCFFDKGCDEEKIDILTNQTLHTYS